MGPAGAENRVLQKMKNSGNEAKKWLKTKEVTFFDDAICAHFTRIFARFGHKNAQEQQI